MALSTELKPRSWRWCVAQASIMQHHELQLPFHCLATLAVVFSIIWKYVPAASQLAILVSQKRAYSAVGRTSFDVKGYSAFERVFMVWFGTAPFPQRLCPRWRSTELRMVPLRSMAIVGYCHYSSATRNPLSVHACEGSTTGYNFRRDRVNCYTCTALKYGCSERIVVFK